MWDRCLRAVPVDFIRSRDFPKKVLSHEKLPEITVQLLNVFECLFLSTEHFLGSSMKARNQSYILSSGTKSLFLLTSPDEGPEFSLEKFFIQYNQCTDSFRAFYFMS